jgi:hypothetical protein
MEWTLWQRKSQCVPMKWRSHAPDLILALYANQSMAALRMGCNAPTSVAGGWWPCNEP